MNRRRTAPWRILLAAWLLGAGPAWAGHGAGHGAGAGETFPLELGGAPAAGPEGDAPYSPAEAAPAPDGSSDPLSGLGASTAGNAAWGDEFLPPDAAFALSSEVRDERTLVLRWEIAEGYYLYRERFDFRLRDGPPLDPPRLPPGKTKTDEFFGRTEVYYDQVTAALALPPPAEAPGELTLAVTYQGCADAGLCYPPMTRTIPVELAAGGAFVAGAATPPGGTGSGVAGAAGRAGSVPARGAAAGGGRLSEQDRIARSLAFDELWLVLLSFLGFGLLLSLTPCVLPMIPILSSIIVGQGERLSTGRGFALSVVYVLAMAATYTTAGVMAGLSGANLQIAFQHPWVIGGFSAVFVLLALAMFGLYDLQLPAGWQARLAALSNRQRGGTYVGVGVMGFLSALIVGPCVAAPLAGALIYIAQTGDAALGGMALFALSLGMGTPLLALGASAGKLVPRIGPWMLAIKRLFGVVLLGVAVYLLERIVPGWLAMLLWAGLVLVAALCLGAFDKRSAEAGGWQRLRRGVGLAAAVYGAVLVVGAASGGTNPLQPLEGSVLAGPGTRERLAFEPVKGLDGVRREVATAAAAGRPVMLDFYADWCVSCKELERYTFSDPRVQALLADALLLRADVTANDAQDQALLRAFGLFGPPAILFFGPDGRERPGYRVVGFMEAGAFRAHLRGALDLDRGLRSASAGGGRPGEAGARGL